MAALLNDPRATAFVVAASVAAAASTLHAHALLDHAVPAVGSTVKSPPAAVELVFSEDVEPAFSTIEVSGAGDARVETKAMEHPSSGVLVAPLPPLAPGDYSVHWKVVSVDTHVTEGRFRFRVEAP